jgi:WD40 repeat protein
VWDTTNWKLLRSIESEKNRFSRLVFSPDGSLLAAGVNQTTIQFWTTDSFMPIWKLDVARGSIEALTFSSDGVFLATGSSDGVVQIWGVSP